VLTPEEIEERDIEKDMEGAKKSLRQCLGRGNKRNNIEQRRTVGIGSQNFSRKSLSRF